MNHEHKHTPENCDCEHHEGGNKLHACPSDASIDNWVDALIDDLKIEFGSEEE